MGPLLEFLQPLLSDPSLPALIGTQADIAAMVRFEAALAGAEAEAGLIDKQAAAHIAQSAPGFQPDLQRLGEGVLKDGVVVVEFVRQLKAHVGSPHDAFVHFGATSQDVIDTALALKLGGVFDLFDQRLEALLAVLGEIIKAQGNNALMGRTRMQAAIPITVGHRAAVWRGLIGRAHAALAPVRQQNMILSLAGPAGTSDKFGDRIDAIRNAVATSLGLTVPDYVPHAARDRIAVLGGWLSELSGALGKIGQDIALMAQNELGEIALSGSGRSSAMAHKQNPVGAEVLVSLARFNAVQVSGLHQALIHEQERSGAAWTLEWLVLPQMLNATGAALLHGTHLLASIQRIGNASPAR